MYASDFQTAIPTIDRTALEATLTEYEMNLANRFINKSGAVRRSKPKVAKTERVSYDCARGYAYRYTCEEDRLQAYGAFVWRHVVFAISPIRQHQCMPVTDTFLIDEPDHAESRRIEKALMAIADKIVALVPVTQQAGTMRWGRALGMIR